jgi:diguanylate cyclase (GGDEF)-like protein
LGSVIRQVISKLIIPVVLLALAYLIIWKWADINLLCNDVTELKALLNILPILPYLTLFIMIFMGWRYNNTGLIFISLVLISSYIAITHGNTTALSYKLVLFLLPLNFLFYSSIKKIRVFNLKNLFFMFILLLQIFFVNFISKPVDFPKSQFMNSLYEKAPGFAANLSITSAAVYSFFNNSVFGLNISVAAFLMFFIVFAILILRFIFNHNLILTGFLGALFAVFFGLIAAKPFPAVMILFSAAGFILIVANIEASFNMAFIDELTGLPGRRSMNDAMFNLGKKYSIAMIDIDFFKRFNDKYGHKTGDQVLRMVASKLGSIKGNGKAYRFGGEEFVVIYAGKDSLESLSYLEELRQLIASTPFRLRSRSRKKKTEADRGGTSRAKNTARVTVSIGLAEKDAKNNRPEKVLKAADKRLYKAKKAGRNRLKA